jgi:hypothetical protein
MVTPVHHDRQGIPERESGRKNLSFGNPVERFQV